jgi:hypothetical protein
MDTPTYTIPPTYCPRPGLRKGTWTQPDRGESDDHRRTNRRSQIPQPGEKAREQLKMFESIGSVVTSRLSSVCRRVVVGKPQGGCDATSRYDGEVGSRAGAGNGVRQISDVHMHLARAQTRHPLSGYQVSRSPVRFLEQD